jgi:PD-(D/E)XK nuclease superfamily
VGWRQICPKSGADEPTNVNDATYAKPGYGPPSKRGFAGAGRVHPAQPFIRSSFSSRRQSEGHQEPRSVAVPNYQELTDRIIGSAIEMHRHSAPGLLELFYAAALYRELELLVFGYGAKSVYQRSTSVNLHHFDPSSISWRTKPLSWKSKQSRHCCP